MAAISSCPKCDAQVSLPRGADPSWFVRCPICQGEFPLAEALAKAPPELIVVDRSGAVAADHAGPDQPPWASWQPTVADDRPIALHDAVTGAIECEDLVPVPDVAAGRGVLSADLLPPQMPAAMGSAPPAIMPRLAPLPRPGHRHSWLGRLTGIVSGGVVGLVLGYVALLWLGGPSRDFLALGPKLPGFIVPASFHPRWSGLGSTAPAPGREPAVVGGVQLPTAAAETVDQGPVGAARPVAQEPIQAAPAVPEAPPPAAVDVRAYGPPPAGESESGPQPQSPVRHPPSFAPGALGRALSAARTVYPDLATGSLADARARPAMGRAYRALCHLAEVVTFPPPNADPAELERCRAAAGDLVLGLVQQDAKQHELELIANRWIDSAKRSGTGVVLAGMVQAVERTGDLHAVKIALAGQRVVTVLSPIPPSLHANDQAIALGSLVEEPAANLIHYRGNAPQVVWAELIRPIAPPVAAKDGPRQPAGKAGAGAGPDDGA